MRTVLTVIGGIAGALVLLAMICVVACVAVPLGMWAGLDEGGAALVSSVITSSIWILIGLIFGGKRRG